MGRRHAAPVKSGLGIVGFALFAFGSVYGGVGLARYARPNLWTHFHVVGPAAAKDLAFHDMALGVAAMGVGIIMGTVAIVGSRHRRRVALRSSYDRSATTVRSTTIDLTKNVTLPPRPIGAKEEMAPLASRVWDLRLAVDLQQQRLMMEALGAESRIDAELYVLCLGNLIQMVKEAQRATRSVVIAGALKTFDGVGGDEDSFIGAVDRTVLLEKDGHAESLATFLDSGTEIAIGPFSVRLESITAAADALANATVGELSEIRSRTAAKKPSRRTAARR